MARELTRGAEFVRSCFITATSCNAKASRAITMRATGFLQQDAGHKGEHSMSLMDALQGKERSCS
jgi:hypothetical protein